MCFKLISSFHEKLFLITIRWMVNIKTRCFENEGQNTFSFLFCFGSDMLFGCCLNDFMSHKKVVSNF